MKFRTYDPHWNRTGHADAPQYSGQAGLADDYPAKCHCGSQMTRWAIGWGAQCANGHEMTREPV